MNTILLVEDNPHIMKINHAALMMEGYRILEAATAAECLAALDAQDIDLVILDIMLPDGNGVTLCRQIKQKFEIPILFLSALGGKPGRHCSAAGRGRRLPAQAL